MDTWVASVVSDSWDPMDCSLPGSSICGILQARILEWLAVSYSKEPSRPKDQTCVSYVSLAGRLFTTSGTWEKPSIPLHI